MSPDNTTTATGTTEGQSGTNITIRDLIEAGLHFGHQTKRWNPKMARYIFGKRNGIHIIDMAKTLVLLEEARKFVADVTAHGKCVLLVGTKKQAQGIIEETAKACGQPYVTHRWLGGTLTNRETIRGSVNRMRELEAQEQKDGFASYSKKHAASIRRELEKLRRNLTGIANMTELPGALFVIDINREAIAVAEANRLNIPVVAIVDTNCDPDPIDYVIPGNDDALRAISLVVRVIAEAIQSGAREYAKVAAELAREKETQVAEAISAPAPEQQTATPTPPPPPFRKRRATRQKATSRGMAPQSETQQSSSGPTESPQQAPEANPT
ncbi:MAG: 30S ribosomal protein S2 [Kiritimatiellae bacterium]|nr:30S ribosomal protein S2 [Kiritimatiellia bacterium]